MNRMLVALVALIGLTGLTGCMGLTWPTGVHGPPMPCRPCGPSGTGPVPPNTKGGPTVLSGLGVLTHNEHDSYVPYGMALVSGTEDPVSIPVALGGTLSNLRVKITMPPGAGSSWTFTVDKNRMATALSCSIAGAGTSCADASLVGVAVGDKLDLDVTPFGKPALATVTWSVRLTPERKPS
jgi:hypothetical protein